MGHLQPLNIFLRQEIDRMRKVLSIVKATLTDLKLAIDGTIIMNEVCTHATEMDPCDTEFHKNLMKIENVQWEVVEHCVV